MYSKGVVPENSSKRVFGWYAKYYGNKITDEFNDDGSENIVHSLIPLAVLKLSRWHCQ